MKGGGVRITINCVCEIKINFRGRPTKPLVVEFFPPPSSSPRTNTDLKPPLKQDEQFFLFLDE